MSRTVGVLLALFVLAGCGSSGVAPTGAALHARQCPVIRLSSKLAAGSCRSPDGAWRLRFRQGTANGRLFLTRHGESNGTEMYHSSNACCQDIAWVKPHLLLFLDAPLVESLDPATRKVTLLGDLSEAVVAPNGRWVAGTGSAGPEEPIATTLYVLGVGAKKCLVVPGRSLGAAGFTRDGQAVIVRRAFHDGKWQLRQFSLSSLSSNCPRDVVTQRVTQIGS